MEMVEGTRQTICKPESWPLYDSCVALGKLPYLSEPRFSEDWIDQ